MKILSIQQPWSWFIVQGHKNVENREWTTSYRGPVLIHTGKRVDPSFFDRNGHFVIPRSYQFFDSMKLAPRRREDYEVGGIIGIATLTDVVQQSYSPWFVGTYGFVLAQASPLPFIPLRGQLGLFDVPAEVEAQVNEILRKDEEQDHDDDTRAGVPVKQRDS